RVRLGGGGVESIQHAHVLIIEVDVDVAVQVPLGGEELLPCPRVLLRERAERVTDGLAVDGDLRLAVGLRAHHAWDLARRHRLGGTQGAKTEQVGGRGPVGEASVLKTYASETTGRGRRDATVCSALTRRRRARSRGTCPSPTPGSPGRSGRRSGTPGRA